MKRPLDCDREVDGDITLRDLRVEACVPLAEAADFLGVSPRHLSEVEHERETLKPAYAKKLERMYRERSKVMKKTKVTCPAPRRQEEKTPKPAQKKEIHEQTQELRY